MNITKALEIVLDLASQNVIDDPEMKEERLKQNDAIEWVAYYLENFIKKGKH
jgi:hypothetical protein